MATKSNIDGLSQRERVFQLIVDSYMEHHRPASRKWLCQETGLTPSAADEHIKNLKNEGRIHADTPGYYQPIPDLPPDRPITVTVMNNGMRKLEWGEEIAEFTPHEWATIGSLSAGAHQRLIHREAEMDHGADVTALKARVRQLVATLSEMAQTLSVLKSRAQADLFTETPGIPHLRMVKGTATAN
jgi:hypothetical protein